LYDAQEAVKPDTALINTIASTHGDHFRGKCITPEFYATFWSLSLEDMEVPVSSYKEEITKYTGQIKALEVSNPLQKVDERRKTEAKAEQLKDLVANLEKELVKQTEMHKQTQAKLQVERALWFPIVGQMTTEYHMNRAAKIMEHCLLPRLLSTPQDAYYCSRFLKYLLDNDTPGLSFMCLLLAISKLLRPVLSICSPNQATFFGRFLHGFISYVSEWVKKKEDFDAKASKLSIFHAPGLGKKPIPATEWCSAVRQFHFQFTTTCGAMMVSPNEVEQRNVLMVLSQV
jgi:THO complex subunit 2